MVLGWQDSHGLEVLRCERILTRLDVKGRDQGVLRILHRMIEELFRVNKLVLVGVVVRLIHIMSFAQAFGRP